MGVLGEFIGFDGRIGRLGLLCRSAMAIAALVAIYAAAGQIIAFGLGPGGMAELNPLMRRLFAGLFLLGVWTGFALAARRLRDMGLEPVYILPAWFALWALNEALAVPLGRPRTEPAAVETLWTAVQSAAAALLLLWPGRAGRPSSPPMYLPAQPTAYLNWREGG